MAFWNLVRSMTVYKEQQECLNPQDEQTWRSCNAYVRPPVIRAPLGADSIRLDMCGGRDCAKVLEAEEKKWIQFCLWTFTYNIAVIHRMEIYIMYTQFAASVETL